MLNTFHSLLIDQSNFIGVVVTILIVGLPTYYYKLRPESIERKRQISNEKFESLSIAHDNLKDDNPTSKARLEFRGRAYLGKLVNYELIDMAYKTDRPMVALDALERSGSYIYKKNGEFGCSPEAYAFPTHEEAKYYQKLGLLFYIIGCFIFFGYIILALNFSAPVEHVGTSAIVSFIPFTMMVISMANYNSKSNLSRIGDMVKEVSPERLSLRKKKGFW
ncbi:hypothetical protein [Kushneria sp. EE4]